jgi:hypothetical protein
MAEELIREIAERRDEGELRGGVTAERELPAVAAAFELADDPSRYRTIDRADAMRLLVRVFHRGLAYSSTVCMPREEAERYAEAVLDLVPGSNVTYYTNGTWHLPDAPDPRWHHVTLWTFDTGVIAIGETGSLCVWVTEED